ncbi:hypothetical protein EBB07_14430 [Paenibacillaceae bacterium]|nr:hypothetical protein EBB07_14430 [Paenibacillaceae bacterium]
MGMECGRDGTELQRRGMECGRDGAGTGSMAARFLCIPYYRLHKMFVSFFPLPAAPAIAALSPLRRFSGDRVYNKTGHTPRQAGYARHEGLGSQTQSD